MKLFQEQIQELVRDLRNDFFLYPAPVLNMRIQEEMCRTDKGGLPFWYLALYSNPLLKALPESVSEMEAWRTIFLWMSRNLRGSDIRGFLEDEKGIAVLFLDHQPDSAFNVPERLLQFLRDEKLIGPDLKVEELMEAASYPETLHS